jgi:hypothetical protein
MVTTRKKKKIFYGDGPSIDFRGHLAVLGILAARLARAVYHMLRKQEAFDEDRFWNGQAKQPQAPTGQTRPAAASGSRPKARAAAR